MQCVRYLSYYRGLNCRTFVMVYINLQIAELVQKNATWKSTFMMRECIRVTPIHYVQSPEHLIINQQRTTRVLTRMQKATYV